MAAEIVPFIPGLAPYFEALNREWIERWFAVEPKDEVLLRDPHATIVAPGGAVFFAVEGGEPVGTAAAIRHDGATFELAKMGVTPRCQGRGYGRALSEAVIRFAAAAGAGRVIVLSDSRLAAAVRLYERLGFRHAPRPADTRAGHRGGRLAFLGDGTTRCVGCGRTRPRRRAGLRGRTKGR